MEIIITITYDYFYALHEDIEYGEWYGQEYENIGHILLERLRQRGINIPNRYEIKYYHNTGGGMADIFGELLLYIPYPKSLEGNCSVLHINQLLSEYFGEPVDLSLDEELTWGEFDFVNEEFNCCDFLEEGSNEETGEQPSIWIEDCMKIQILR